MRIVILNVVKDLVANYTNPKRKAKTHNTVPRRNPNFPPSWVKQSATRPEL